MTRNDRATAQLHREWLRRLPTITGKSLTRLADEIGVARSTMTRPLKQRDAGTSTLHAATIDKIVRHTGIEPPGSAIAVPRMRALRGFAEDAIRYEPDGNAISAAVSELVAGRPNADPWVIKTRALELAGYLPGDIVVVDLALAPQHGDIVCAQVNIDWARGTAETAMRIYDRAGSSNVLLAATLDPALRSPIAVDDRVAVKGVVIGMVRPQRVAA